MKEMNLPFLLIQQHITEAAICKPTESFFSDVDMEAFPGNGEAKHNLTITVWHVGAQGQGFPLGLGENRLAKGMGLFLINLVHPVSKRSLALAQSCGIVH